MNNKYKASHDETVGNQNNLRKHLRVIKSLNLIKYYALFVLLIWAPGKEEAFRQVSEGRR